MMSSTQMIDDRGKLQDFLFTNAMKGNWKNVVDMCAKDSRAHEVEITKSKDTALHLAVFDNQERTVAELVQIIRSFNFEKVLEKQNERKNTPLHIAASLGSVRMCKSIASVNPLLVDIRNGDGETPLFLAALHGHKNAFLCLHSFCSSSLRRLHANCRRNDGDSILHCAIRNEHFDLSFQIINLNKEIVNWVNGQGLTPLHLLASKPTAFKSGSRHIGRWQQVVYHCIFVDELKPEAAPCCQASTKIMCKPKKPSYPENYETCTRFFQLLWEGILLVSNLKRVLNKKKNLQAKNGTYDPEDDEANDGPNFEKDEDEESADSDLLEVTGNNHRNEIFPENYDTCMNIVKVVCKAILIVLGSGSIEIRKIRDKKEKHTWSIQVMNSLLAVASLYKYGYDGNTPLTTRLQSDDATETRPYIFNEKGVGFNKGNVTDGYQEHKNMKATGSRNNEPKETPVLIAAKNGVVEMVKKILELFPVAIHDMNVEKKNVVLLAAEYRQPDVYKLLLEKKLLKESVFRQVDHKGNSALHLAANLGAHKPWRIRGSALQMQWEIKWYQFVKNSMPLHFFVRYNNAGKIPKNIFHETHMELAKSGGEWLTSTSESCSVVAALIATVAFATAATVPGGNDQENGTPLLECQAGFQIFALSSLVALCFSVTSVVMFLAILTSRYEERDFESSLPWKLLLGLSSLFCSIVAMLVSFCAGHFFLLNSQFQHAAVLLYTIIFLPVALMFAVGQFPLYLDLLQAIIKNVPRRSSEVILSD